MDEMGEKIEVLSGGNFHGEPLAIGMDYLGIAMTELGNISERRLMRLLDADSNGGILPPFLTREGGVNSGFMLLQYTAAALAAENKVLAHPSSVDTIPTSANVEDHVSMGVTAGLQLRQINSNVEHMLSLELMAAAQGLDFRREVLGDHANLGKGTRRAYELVRQEVPFLENDEIYYDYIEKVKSLVTNGKICY
jgi:histidine ammonia-lyase